MAVQPNLKSTGVTNLAATPRVANTAGKGAPGRLVSVNDVLPAMTTAGTAGGIMRVVRVPSDCIIKGVYWMNAATVTTVDCDVGLYYSDTADGTSSTNVAGAGTAIDADFFASAVAMETLKTAWQDVTFESGVYTAAKANKELWDAAGLTTDPGGFFDIALTNTSTTSGAPVLSLRVDYVQPS